MLAALQESLCQGCVDALCGNGNSSGTGNVIDATSTRLGDWLGPGICNALILACLALLLVKFLARRFRKTACYWQLRRCCAPIGGRLECCWRRCFLPLCRRFVVPLLALALVVALVAGPILALVLVYRHWRIVAAIVSLLILTRHALSLTAPPLRLLLTLLVATIYEFFFRFRCIGESYLSAMRSAAKLDKGEHHSRFADLRFDLELPGGGLASVHTIPCIKDNYAYLVVDRKSLAACIVDPADALCAMKAVAAIQKLHYDGQELDLQAVLTTHWHWDHQAGNQELQKLLKKDLKVYGGEGDDVLACTDEVTHRDTIDVGALCWDVMGMPGHTRGSVAYRLRGKGGRDCLMTGDALFCGGGCGAPFEACKGELERNLVMVLRECGDDTLMFPGHDYTLRLLSELPPRDEGSSMEFALALAGAKEMAVHRQQHEKAEDRLPTVPLRLSEERCFQLLGPMAGQRLLQHIKVLRAVLVRPAAPSSGRDRRDPDGGSEDSDSEDRDDAEDGSRERLSNENQAPALIFGHGQAPYVSPFICLFRCDYERLCGKLEAGGGGNGAVGRELREAPVQLAPGDLRDEVNRQLKDLPKELPDVVEVQQALLALAVDHDESIGREACQDLAKLHVDETCLTRSLATICGGAAASSLLAEASKETWGLSIRDAAWRLHEAARERRPEPSCFADWGRRCRACSNSICKSGKKKRKGKEKDKDNDEDSDFDFEEAVKPLLRVPKHDICVCRICSSGLSARRPIVREFSTLSATPRHVVPISPARSPTPSPGPCTRLVERFPSH